MITTDTQAHHERVLKVLSEDGETPPSWLGYILLCRCPNFSFKLIGWLLKEVKQEIFMYCLCLLFLRLAQDYQGLQLPHDQDA